MTTENENAASPLTVTKAAPKKVAPKKAAPKKAAPKKAVTKKSTAMVNKPQPSKAVSEEVASFPSRRVWPD